MTGAGPVSILIGKFPRELEAEFPVDDSAKLTCLLGLARELGVEVRRMPEPSSDPARPGGSMVRLKGRPVVFVDFAASLPDQLDVMASALAGRPELQDRFLPPEIRLLLDSSRP